MSSEIDDLDPDMVPTVNGIVYKGKDGRHVLQFHTADDDDVTYEFEIAEDKIAAGLKGIGNQLLEEMDSPMRKMALSPAEADRRQEQLKQARIEEVDDGESDE